MQAVDDGGLLGRQHLGNRLSIYTTSAARAARRLAVGGQPTGRSRGRASRTPRRGRRKCRRRKGLGHALAVPGHRHGGAPAAWARSSAAWTARRGASPGRRRKGARRIRRGRRRRHRRRVHRVGNPSGAGSAPSASRAAEAIARAIGCSEPSRRPRPAQDIGPSATPAGTTATRLMRRAVRCRAFHWTTCRRGAATETSGTGEAS